MLSGSASRSLLDLSPQRTRHQRSFSRETLEQRREAEAEKDSRRLLRCCKRTSGKEMAGSRVLRSLSCFSAAISATESDTRCVVLPRCHTAVLHTASSPFYDVPSIVLVSWCVTAVLQTSTFYTSTLYDVPSTMLVSWCDTAVLQTCPLYEVPSIVFVSRCDIAVLRTTSSLCYNIPSTVLFPRSAEHASHNTTGKRKL